MLAMSVGMGCDGEWVEGWRVGGGVYAVPGTAPALAFLKKASQDWGRGQGRGGGREMG